jgi:hypothetical protein
MTAEPGFVGVTCVDVGLLTLQPADDVSERPGFQVVETALPHRSVHGARRESDRAERSQAQQAGVDLFARRTGELLGIPGARRPHFLDPFALEGEPPDHEGTDKASPTGFVHTYHSHRSDPGAEGGTGPSRLKGRSRVALR